MQGLLDFFKNFIGIFTTMSFPVDYLDIIVVAVLIYFVMKFARETRMGQLIKGVLLILFLHQVAKFLNFTAFTYILENTIQLSFIAVLVVFQPELRSGLERIGRVKLGTIKGMQSIDKKDYNTETNNMITAICESCKILSSRKIGALMVFEVTGRLGEIHDTGFNIDSTITPQTLITIFFPNTPLHDGAIIIRNNRIMSAGCLLPLSKNLDLNRELGTRHRAALGITESSDAIAVVVSEETGKISYAINGKLYSGVKEDDVRKILEEKLIIPEKKFDPFKIFKKEVTDNEK